MEIKPEVFIRADGSSTIGLGHLIRCSALAHMLKADFQITFYCKEIPDALVVEFEAAGFRLRKIETEEAFFLALKPKQIAVLDGYGFDTEYQRRIKEKGSILVCIDDFCGNHYVCDVLINNIPGYKDKDFSREAYTKLYLGIDYALLRYEFLKPKWRTIQKEKNNVFVSFGGSDFNNLTQKICAFLSMVNPDLNVNVVVGTAYQHIKTLKEFPNFQVFKNVSAEEVAGLMAKAEICIVPASSLLNEVASIGSKTLVGYFAENQIQPYNYFVKHNMAIGMGNILSINFNAFKTSFLLAKRSQNILNNQYKAYRYQQAVNLKNIFSSI